MNKEKKEDEKSKSINVQYSLEREPDLSPVASGTPINVEDSFFSLEKERERLPASASPPDLIMHTQGHNLATCSRKRLLATFAILVVIIVLVAVLAIVAATRGTEEPELYVPTTVDFSTGVSLITSYEVTAEISSRLAQTTVAMVVENALDCSSIHSITLQLPVAARVASVRTISDNGCTTGSEVQKLLDARTSFLESASEGLPGVYVEEQDSSTNSIQVAIPPLGITTVELVIEQLVHTKLGVINFEVPLVPNELVDSVVLDLNVNDISSEGDNGTEFSVDIGSEWAPKAISNYFLSIPDARQHSLPKVLSGKYQPGTMPSSGIVHQTGACFEHFFRPPFAEPMPKNILFLLDTSTTGDNKLIEYKAGIKDFIDTLTPADTFTIQTFASRGTIDLWGPLPATAAEKADAKLFLNQMVKTGYGRDLHEALLEGLLRSRRDAENSSDDTITILVLLLSGWANRGETDSRGIVENVYKRNRDGKVKMFALGFENSADMNLLAAITTTNGGVSTALVGSNRGDYAQQILHFMQSEFGEVLLADVNVALKSPLGKTNSSFAQIQEDFSMLTDGYEIVVRGLLGDSEANEKFHVVTTARTKEGPIEWTATPVAPAIVVTSDEDPNSSPCYRSYAHSRITELMRLRDAAYLIEDSILRDFASLRDPCEEEDLAVCIENEALSLALKAGVVVKGLTGMVTTDDDQCLSFDGEAEICRDGSTAGVAEATMADYGMTKNTSGCYRLNLSAIFFLNAIVIVFAMLVLY